MQYLKIEMIHDVVCSWCHIGYHNISKALENLSNEVSAEFHYLPFQLNPELGPQGVDITEHLRQRNRWSLAEAMAYRAKLLEKTYEVGVTIDFSKRTHYYNTEKAHRLLLVAESVGVQRKMHQALLYAYHVNGQNISDIGVLMNIAEGVGLTESVVAQAMESETISRKMQLLSERVDQFSVRSVPAFIFNEHQFVSGSNSVEFFEQHIRREFLTEKLARVS